MLVYLFKFAIFHLYFNANNGTIFFQLQGKHVQALHILASFRHCRYEFLFTNQDLKSTRHYTSVIGVYRYTFGYKICIICHIIVKHNKP